VRCGGWARALWRTEAAIHVLEAVTLVDDDELPTDLAQVRDIADDNLVRSDPASARAEVIPCLEHRDARSRATSSLAPTANAHAATAAQVVHAAAHMTGKEPFSLPR
jgi:hypothetical protein